MERIYVFDLVGVYKKPVSKRGRVAAALLRSLAARHSKTAVDKVKLSMAVNDLLHSHGKDKIPRRVKVKLTSDEKGVVVSLPEEETVKKEEKEVKKILEGKTESKEEKQEKPKFEPKAVEAASKKFEQKAEAAGKN